MIDKYKNKRIRKSGVVTSWYQLQINGEILLKCKEAAEQKKTDTNDYIIQAILKKLEDDKK